MKGGADPQRRPLTFRLRPSGFGGQVGSRLNVTMPAPPSPRPLPAILSAVALAKVEACRATADGRRWKPSAKAGRRPPTYVRPAEVMHIKVCT